MQHASEGIDNLLAKATTAYCSQCLTEKQVESISHKDSVFYIDLQCGHTMIFDKYSRYIGVEDRRREILKENK